MIHQELYPCLSMGQKQIIGVAILVVMLLIVIMRQIAKRKLKTNSRRNNVKRNHEIYYLDFIIDSKNKTLQEIQKERAEMIKLLKEIRFYA